MDIDDYSRRYAAQYESREWFETVLVGARRRQVLGSLARHPHESVLEIGCGLEPLFAFTAPVSSWTVVEPSPEFVKVARERAAGRSDVKIVEGFLESSLDRISGSFELIVASSLLHEVPDPNAFLRCLRAVASPRTIVHLNVPNVRSFHRLLAFEMGLISDVFEKSEMEQKFQRTTRFDAVSLQATCESAGFRVLRTETYFVKPFTHRQMEQIVDQGIVDRRMLDALERMTKYMPDLGCEVCVELVCS